MTKTKTYKSDASHSIYELASALHCVGAINKKTALLQKIPESAYHYSFWEGEQCQISNGGIIGVR